MKDTIGSCTFSKLLDNLPYGLDEGVGKLVLSHKASSLVMGLSDDPTPQSLENFSYIAQKVSDYQARSEGLRDGFAQSAKRYAGKAASFTAENSVIFGAAAIGAVVGGGIGGISGSAAATFPHVLGNSFLKEMDKAGYDVKDPGQLKAAIDDDVFMTQARGSSFIHAGQMSAAVLAAGALAGHVYKAVAKPAASISASMTRSVLATRLVGEVTEKSTGMIAEVMAKAVKSGVNSVGRKAVQALPVRALFLSAAVTGVSVDDIQQADLARPPPLHVEETRRLPNYNTSSMYL